MVKYSFPYGSHMRVPRPTICLNSVMPCSPYTLSSTTSLQVLQFTPVVRSFGVVTIVGYFSSGSMNSSSFDLPSFESPVMRMM